ncbi:hypothetical protein C8R45DRAFT_1046138 [Mycena sanguinolenta]|nr:hypothetical protein C8R45DRAFT_1046138 [Mycena sanguinolenta]
MRFSDHVSIRWVPQGERVFECQFLTVPETHQLAVENLPDVKGYSTGNLFEWHPTKPDLYRMRVVGRIDDVIIMANGEKTVPGPMEDVILTCPFIKATIIFGCERAHIGVLIEPTEEYMIDPSDEHQLVNYRNLIWSTIDKANKIAPAFARIYKEMVLVTQPGKPLLRASKGTLLKKQSLVLYEQEIEELYGTVAASGNTASNVEPPSSWSSQDLEAWLQTHASLVANRDIRPGRDLFDQGFDSLNATFLRHRIMSALTNLGDNQAAQKISLTFIYAHPTIEELANAMITLVNGDVNDLAQNTQADVVERMIEKYRVGFETPLNRPEKIGVASSDVVVLLTGSTGGLGSHILEILLALPCIDRVYACNRKGKISVPERQKESFVDKALDVALLSSNKLVYLECDTTKENLELPLDVWTMVRNTVTIIIHNAWNLDFNKALSSFEPHVKGTRNLIDLARQLKHQVRFLFTSSVGSAFGWDQKLGPFPEELQLDANVAVGGGYGEAKYVCERILASSGLDATSFRIGQITGSKNSGAWATSDWVPTIVKSSITLGNFPSDSSGVVAWLPPAAISRAIMDVALKPEKPPFAVNLVHLCPIPWNLVMSTMANTAQLPLIPFTDWVQQLQDRSLGATTEEIPDLPGIMLLDFLKATASEGGGVEFSTAKAQALSDSMKSLKPLNEDDVKQWMQYWRKRKFIV